MGAVNEWLNQFPEWLVLAGFFIANFTVALLAGLFPLWLQTRSRT